MKRSTVVLFLLAVLLPVHSGRAEEPGSRAHAPDLRLVHVTDGLRSVAPRRDLSKLPETDIYKVARKAGVALESPSHPLLLHRYANGRLFYVFYKIAENAFGDRPYVIQRIRKTERTWASEAATEPSERVTYQVEVFKTFGGALKRPDQHYGSFGLRGNHRREIVKEYEIGFAEIPGVCEGTDWPLDHGILFKYLQRYQEEPGLHDQVDFHASRRWRLDVAFAEDGTYHVRSEELGFDAPLDLPDEGDATPKPHEDSRRVVLEAGRGPERLAVGEGTLDQAKRRLGGPLQSTVFPGGQSSHSFRCGLTLNFDENKTLTTVWSMPGFLGHTTRGLKHGDHRARVMEVMGVPRRQYADAWSWKYDGIRFTFDGYDRVSRISVFRK